MVEADNPTHREDNKMRDGGISGYVSHLPELSNLKIMITENVVEGKVDVDAMLARLAGLP